ncbi:MAG: hypothetical protein KDB65_03070 [Calditrichaeota bacterium]|nr:hypothetical protein [Calditrichota bacterium]MCB9367894.1 hypothetical protein [Calditrichota bacterium]
MKLLTSILLVLLISLSANARARNSGFPLLSNSSYDFAERYETRERIWLYSEARPRIKMVFHMRRDSTAEARFIVDSISARIAPPVRRLSIEAQRYQIEERARERIYGGDINVMPVEDWRVRFWPPIFDSFYTDRVYFFSDWRNFDELAFGIQPVYGFEYIDTDDERGSISRFAGGLRLEAGYKQRLYAMVDFRDYTETGNGPYETRSSLYEDRWAAIELKGDNSTSYDISESLIQYYGTDLAVTAGRGRHQWGPSYFGGLILNGYAPPFDYLRFDAAPGRVNYTFLHGVLESTIPSDTLYINPDGRPRTINSQKYISAQRLEIMPGPNALFGFSQAVIYGDRGVQLGYLTPMNFLYSVQHSNDDKDNLLLSFDGKWRIKPGLKVYGEFLLDDVIVSDIFGNSGGGSKNAYTLGVHGIIPKPFWEKFDARFEYTKVRPFVYSHFFGVNKYTHWTSSLGYTNEPNSEFIHFRLGASFYPLYAAISYERQNHGANTDEKNVGGSIDAPNFGDSDSDFVFLDGQFIRTETITLSGRYEVLPNLNLLFSLSNISQSKLDNRTEIHAGFGWNL